MPSLTACRPISALPQDRGWTQNFGYDYSGTGTYWSACVDGGIEPTQCDETPNSWYESNGNYAQASIWARHPGERYGFALMYMGGARVYLNDFNDPIPLYFQEPPAGWVHTVPAGPYNGPNEVHIRWGDEGLGIRRMWMEAPGMATQYAPDIYCTGTQTSRCQPDRAHNFSYASLPEGVRTVTYRSQDPLLRNGRIDRTLKIDRSSPHLLSVTGYLRDRENKAIYETTASVRVTSQDGSASAPRSGVRTTDLLVDGQIHDSVTEPCPSGQCPYTPPARDLTLRTDDVGDGRRTIQVRVKDLLGHVAVSQSWEVIVDRRGDVYVAEERDAEPAAQGESVATEWGQLGTRNARRIDGGDITTRGIVACSLDPNSQCGETRYVTRAEEGGDESGDSYASYKGTTVNDPRLEHVASILEPSYTDLGVPTDSGLLSDALLPNQTPPPAHGATYELYAQVDEVEIDGQPAEVLRRIWTDTATGLLLRETTVQGGEVTSDLYYDYRPERLERSELPGDYFAVARPSGASSDVVVDYATEPPPSPPADAPAPTVDDQVAEAQAFREDFGLRSDEPYVRQTVEDPALESSIDSFGIPLTSAEEAELRLRDDAEEKMDLIDDYGATQAPDSYAGTYIDQEQGGLVYVGFTLNTAQHMAALEQIYPYPDRLRSFTAVITLPELMALHQQIGDDIDTLIADGFDIVSVAEDEETNSVVVTVPAPTPLQELQLRTRYGLQVRLEQEDYIEPENDGSNERIFWKVPPVYGGLHIFSRSAQCSTGFSVRRGKARRLLTAGHCGTRGVAWSHWSGTTENPVSVGTTVSRSYRNRGPGDFALIKIKRRFATPLLLVRPASPKRRYLRIRKAAPFEAGRVRSRRHKGTRICRVGYRFTPPKCGRLVARAVDVVVRDGGTRRTFRNQHAANYRSRSGDSGGAVFSGSTAFGIHFAGPRGSGPGRRYFTPIEAIMKKFNVKLVGVT